MITWCDIRLATKDAGFSIKETQMGMVRKNFIDFFLSWKITRNFHFQFHFRLQIWELFKGYRDCVQMDLLGKWFEDFFQSIGSNLTKFPRLLLEKLSMLKRP